jgi:fimbrial isopeptide formation D2 family protein
MKRLMSKLMTTIITLAMVLAMGLPAFAIETDKVTLTLRSEQEGAEYSVYQVMTASELSDDLYSYTVNADFEGAFPITVDSNEYVLNENNEICLKEGSKEIPITSDGLSYNKKSYNRTSDTALVAAVLEKYARENNVPAAVTVSMGSSGEETVSLPIGYYVIKQTKVPEKDQQNGYIASKAVLVNLTENKKVTVKDDTEKLDKTITGLNDVKTENLDENTASIGDTINYKVTTYIPTYGEDVKKDSLKFKLTDTFSDGITFNKDVVVYLSDTEGDTSDSNKLDASAYTYTSETGTFDVNLNPETIYANQGRYVTLVYSGMLNEKAQVNSKTGNTNVVSLDYTNGPDMEEQHLSDKVKTYTFGLGVKKVDKATGEELDGAKFKLTKDGQTVKLIKESEDVYRVANDGDIDTVEEIEVNSASGHNPVIRGLDEGTYVLRETAAPDSYSKVSDITVAVTANKGADGMLTGSADITVSGGKSQQGDNVADDSVKTTATNGTIDINIYVEDTKGISLPETGGKTAMVCLMLGALLVVAGGSYLGITNRKKNI